MPGVRITLKCPKPQDNFPPPKTIGEHIKTRRRALGLYQKDAARMIGVNHWTVINWEKNRTAPPPSAYPAIIGFLGYDPFPPPVSIPERLKAKRRALGWSIRKAARQLDVDPATFSDWERGKTILFRRHRARLADFLGIDGAALAREMARAWSETHVRE